MFILETSCDKDEVAFINEQINTYPEIEAFEIDSVGLEPIIQIAIPLAAILSPVVATIITKITENRRVTIKFDDVEITAGSYKEAKKIIDDIIQLRTNENN